MCISNCTVARNTPHIQISVSSPADGRAHSTGVYGMYHLAVRIAGYLHGYPGGHTEVYQHHTGADTHDQVEDICVLATALKHVATRPWIPQVGGFHTEVQDTSDGGTIQRSRYLRSRDTMPSGVEDVCTLATAL